MGIITSLILFAASTGYQLYKQKEAARKAKKAYDKSLGMDVPAQFESVSLATVYGLNAIGGSVVWSRVTNNYKDTYGPDLDTGFSGRKVPKITYLTPSLFLSIISNVDNYHEWYRYNGAVYARNENAYSPATYNEENPLYQLNHYFNYLAPDAQVAEWAAGGHPALEQRLDNAADDVDAKESLAGDLFAKSNSPYWDYVHIQGLENDDDGDDREFLFLQQAICAEGIHRVITATVDENRISYPRYQKGQRIQVKLNTATTGDPWIVSNTDSERASALFTGMTHASACFKLDRESPQYSGVPSLTFIVEGNPTYEILNPSTGVYTLSATKTYSTNGARILLDYLVYNTYGPRLPLTKLRLKSFYEAQQLYETVKATVPIRGYEAMSRFDAKTPEFEQLAEIKLGECHVVLPTDAPIRENVSRILDSLPGASLPWSDGQYSLVVRYPTSEVEQTALLAMSLDDDDLVAGEFTRSYPSLDTRLNQVSMNFSDAGAKMKSDVKTWPPENSTLFNTYLAQDNGVLLKADVEAPAARNSYQALVRAEEMVRESRTKVSFSFRLRKRALRLEPGDLVYLSSLVYGVHEVLQIDSIEPDVDTTLAVEASSFSWDTLAHNVEDTDPGPLPTRTFDDFPNPEDFQYNPGVSNAQAGSPGLLSWTWSGGRSAVFQLYVSTDTGQTFSKLGETSSTYFPLPELEDGNYHFAITARSIKGRVSAQMVLFVEGLESPRSGENNIDRKLKSELVEPAPKRSYNYLTDTSQLVQSNGRYWRSVADGSLVTNHTFNLDPERGVFSLGGTSVTQSALLTVGRSTNKWVLDKDGLLQVVAAGVPAVGYDLFDRRSQGYIWGPGYTESNPWSAPSPLNCSEDGATASLQTLSVDHLGVFPGMRIRSTTAAVAHALGPAVAVTSGQDYFIELHTIPGSLSNFRFGLVDGGTRLVVSGELRDEDTLEKTNSLGTLTHTFTKKIPGSKAFVKRFKFVSATTGSVQLLYGLDGIGYTDLLYWSVRGARFGPVIVTSGATVTVGAENPRFNFAHTSALTATYLSSLESTPSASYASGDDIPEAANFDPVRFVYGA